MMLFPNPLWMFFLLLISSPALAGGETYLDINLASYHFSRAQVAQQDMNEVNPGIGIERESGAWRQMGGVYRNSLRRTSAYLLAGYSPVRVGSFSLGVFGGAVTGYEVLVAPAAGLIASLQFARVGLNLTVVPDAHIMHKQVDGFAGLQMRYRF